MSDIVKSLILSLMFSAKIISLDCISDKTSRNQH